MKYQPLIISFLGTVLWASTTFAAVSVSDHEVITTALPGTLSLSSPQSLSAATPMESTYEDAAGGELEATSALDFVQPDGELSTFGIMAVGLAGLFWVRRNSAKL